MELFPAETGAIKPTPWESPAAQGHGTATGEGSEPGEFIVPNFGEFYKPHFTEEQRGKPWFGDLGGFELKIPHQRGPKNSLKGFRI